MSQRFDDELISAFLDGELTADEQSVVERVLSDSDEYRRMYDEMRALRNTLQSLPVSEPDEDLSSRILRRAERTMLVPGESPAPDKVVRIERPSEVVRGPAGWRMASVALVSAAALVLLLLFAVDPSAVTDIARAPTESSDSAPDTANEGDRFEGALEKRSLGARDKSAEPAWAAQAAPDSAGAALPRNEKAAAPPARSFEGPLGRSASGDAAGQAKAPAAEAEAERPAPSRAAVPPPAVRQVHDLQQAEALSLPAGAGGGFGSAGEALGAFPVDSYRVFELTLTRESGDVDLAAIERTLRAKQLELSKHEAQGLAFLKMAPQPDAGESFEPDVVAFGTAAQVREALEVFSHDAIRFRLAASDRLDPRFRYEMEESGRRMRESELPGGGAGFGGGGLESAKSALSRAVRRAQQDDAAPETADENRPAADTRVASQAAQSGSEGKKETVDRVRGGLPSAAPGRASKDGGVAEGLAGVLAQKVRVDSGRGLRVLVVIVPDEAPAAPAANPPVKKD